MQHNTNRATIQGTLQSSGSHDAPVYTICGIGIDAAAIAGIPTGTKLRVEGTLHFNYDTQTFSVIADHLCRMERRAPGPVAPPTKTRDHVERALPPENTPGTRTNETQ
jgi:hypothetical protein